MSENPKLANKEARKNLKIAIRDATKGTDPTQALHLEAMESNDHLSDIKDILTTQKESPDIVQSAQSFFKSLKGEKGDKPTPQELTQLIKPLIPIVKDGQDGKTPVRGQDYLHEGDMQYLRDNIATPEILKRATPIKGIHYRDGVNGKDGKDGMHGKDGRTIKGPPGEPGKDGKDGMHADPRKVIEALKKLPEKEKLEFKDIRNSAQYLGGMHGAGVTKIIAGSGVSISSKSPAQSGLGDVTISVSGGSGISSINTDTTSAQILTVGSSGTDFAIVDNGTGTHTFNLPVASALNTGKLSSTDWSTFNSKQSALTLGNLTDVGTDGITIGSGVGAVVGSGTTISQHVADTSHNGYLSSTDWNTFNGKISGLVIGTTTITSGTTTRILYDNAGVVGEYTISGLGTVVAMQTSPSLITPALGVATATSLAIGGATIGSNGLAVTGHLLFEGVTSTGATGTGKLVFDTAPTFQTSINGAYLTASQILITDGSSNIVSAPVATYPSLTELTYLKGVTSAIQTQLNAKGTGTVTAVSIATANGFSGSSSGGATPALTIVAGAITPTSVNGLTISTTTGTLTLTNLKTLAVTNTLTLSGTDSTVMTFPTTSATIARTDAAQTFTGTQTFSQVVTTNNTVTVTANAGTVPITSRINTFTNSSASAMTITMATASAVDGQLSEVRIYDFSAVAEGITWVNTENSSVTAPTTSNGSTTSPLSVLWQFNGATSKWRFLNSV